MTSVDKFCPVCGRSRDADERPQELLALLEEASRLLDADELRTEVRRTIGLLRAHLGITT